MAQQIIFASTRTTKTSGTEPRLVPGGVCSVISPYINGVNLHFSVAFLTVPLFAASMSLRNMCSWKQNEFVRS